jgi:acetolactate synthase-1/2/3 large subunit
MVRFQEISKYGRDSGVKFGPVNMVQYAEAFGAHGFQVRTADELGPTLKKAMDLQGPVVIGVPVDYSDNMQLMETVHRQIIV